MSRASDTNNDEVAVSYGRLMWLRDSVIELTLNVCMSLYSSEIYNVMYIMYTCCMQTKINNRSE